MPNINSTVVPVVLEMIQGAGKVKYDGVDLGSHSGGISIDYNPEWVYCNSEYYAGKIHGEIVNSACTVKITLEQNSIRNMCVAMGGNTSSSSSSSSSVRYDFGPESGLSYGTLVVTGMSSIDNSKARVYTFHKCVRASQVSQTLKKGTLQLLPCVFECLLDANGKYFTVEDPVELSAI